MNKYEQELTDNSPTFSSNDLLEEKRANLFPIEEFPTLTTMWANEGWEEQDSWAIEHMATWILPTISSQYIADAMPARSMPGIVGGQKGHVKPLLNLVKSSGVYAIASVAVPLVSLVLAPFLTHSLSPVDYGVLTLLNTFISLWAGITQLGLASAFFRSYNYDYSAPRDKRAVLSTVTLLLFFTSLLMTIGAVVMAPLLSTLLFGRPSMAGLIALAAEVVLLQNLTIPGFSWLRAENRALPYSLLSIGSLLLTLCITLLLVKNLHLGIAGALIANGCGYAVVVICTLPIIIFRAGIKLRMDIARSLLVFGLPLVLNFFSYWVLQLLDRYLLSVYTSLTQVAIYSVAYTLGSVLSVLVIGPFLLAWPTTMFTIATRKDAPQVFTAVFRWFSMFLLFAAFGLSIMGKIILTVLFPASYHVAASIIPIIALSLVLYGVYYLFMIGANVKRKTWVTAVFTTIAAVVNITLNLILIPTYGAMGAAIATLVAYIALVLSAYIVNQKIYALPFEIGVFLLALFSGIAFYVGGNFFAQTQSIYVAWAINFASLLLYGGFLSCLGLSITRSKSSPLHLIKISLRKTKRI